ncbi:MAG: Cdc6/Cdc18 family protein [Candidatus Njordarchaeota archaeon]
MSFLDDFFDKMLQRKSVFREKRYLSIDYIPERLPHREDEIIKVAGILVNILKGTKPSNIFEYGPVGTGKTAVTKLVLRKLKEKSKNLNLQFSYSYVNCRFYRTSYRALIKIAEDLKLKIPKSGLPVDVIFKMVIDKLEEKFDLFTVVFDEVDWLVKFSGDDILYQFTRLNSELGSSAVSIIGITNDVRFREYLDARVLSSLSEEVVIFQPYNQQQLYDILSQRAKLAFYEESILDEAIRYVAAIAARDGDARRAIDILRVAGEIADRNAENIVTISHVKKACEEVEKNLVGEIVMVLPPNQRLLLVSIVYLSRKRDGKLTTGRVKRVFDFFAEKLGRPTISLRRFNDYISELETLGLISASIVSFGRYGRTRIIKLEVPLDTIEEFLKKDDIYNELFSETIPRHVLS